MAEISIEAGGVVEHRIHVGELGGVPAAEISIEAGGVLEQRVHVGDLQSVPIGDVAILVRLLQYPGATPLGEAAR